MKNFFKLIFAFVVIVVLNACTTSKSTVSQTANLSKYEYAAVINNNTYHIPAELMEYEIQLYDAVEGSNLKLISDSRIYELSRAQQDRLLLVKYGVNITDEETVITVNFIDYITGRPIASCRGAYSTLGVGGSSRDIKGAIKRVAKQISDTFRK